MWGRSGCNTGTKAPLTLWVCPTRAINATAANQLYKAVCPLAPAGPRRLNLITRKVGRQQGVHGSPHSEAHGGLARACGDCSPGAAHRGSITRLPSVCPGPPVPYSSPLPHQHQSSPNGPSSLPGLRSQTVPHPQGCPIGTGTPGGGWGAVGCWCLLSGSLGGLDEDVKLMGVFLALVSSSRGPRTVPKGHRPQGHPR